MAISCSGFNTIALFSRGIIEIDNALVNASLVFWFCFAEMICSVPWNSPIGDYQIFDWRANILIQSERSVRRRTDYSKKAPVLGSGFSLLPPQSPCGFSALARFYYLSAPNQNRHATQATDLGREKVWMGGKSGAHFPARLDFPSPPSKYLPLWVSEDELLPAFSGNGYVIWSWTSINFLSCFNWWANNCVSGPITKHECWPLSSAEATSAENRCVSFVYFHIPSYLKEFLRETDRYNNFASWRKTFYKYKCAYYHPVAPGAD